jgi:hypothetical protein
VTESRRIQYYSAQAAAGAGNVHCHVMRGPLANRHRAEYLIVVGNETAGDAQALAYVPDAITGSTRTVVQTVVGPGSDFSTIVVLELTSAGLMPEVRVALAAGGTLLTLVVPSQEFEPAANVRSSGELLLAIPAGSAALAPRSPLPPAPNAYSPPAEPAAPFITSVPSNASAPLARRPGTAQPAPALAPFLLASVLLAIVGFCVVRPRITALTVPSSAAPGTSIAVAYGTAGFGAADYAVLDPGGQTIARGPLAMGSGSFAVTLPPPPAAPAYQVRLHVANAFDSAVSQGYVRIAMPLAAASAAPRPAPQRRAAAAMVGAPEIRSLALDRATLASGETLTVYYDVLATSGSIALYDPARQITYQKVDLNASGRATFVAPHVDGASFLTVVATAQRGGATAQSRIAVTVAPATPEPVPSAGDTDEPRGDAALDTRSAITSITAPPTVRSGRPIRVDVNGAAAGLHVTLLDDTGREIARRDVPAGQRSVDFSAPAVNKISRFLLEATYPQGDASETIVRAIIVTP